MNTLPVTAPPTSSAPSSTRPPSRTPLGRPAVTRHTVTRHAITRWSARSVATALVGLLALCGLVAPAAAHDALTGSTPADGATVDAPPAAVELTFTNPPLGIGAEVQVTGPDGVVVAEGEPQVTDTTVSQPLPGDLPAGDYGVAWRVTSSDGHPISGELTFTATGGATPAEPAPVATTEPAPAATTEPEPEASEIAPTDAPAEILPEVDEEVEEEGADGVAPWVIGVAIALVLGAVAAWAVRRRATGGDRPTRS